MTNTKLYCSHCCLNRHQNHNHSNNHHHHSNSSATKLCDCNFAMIQRALINNKIYYIATIRVKFDHQLTFKITGQQW